MAEAHQQSPDAVPARHCHQLAVKSLDFVWEPGYALVRRERLSVPREVRLLVSLTVLYVDAFIAAHDAKYTFWRLRPSMADDTIMPLIPPPNHPAYVSNAAIIASGAAALVGSIFLQEAAPWQYPSEGTGLSRIYADSTRRIRQTVKHYATGAGIEKRVYPHLFRHQLLTYLTKHGLISPKLQLLSGHTASRVSPSIANWHCPMWQESMKQP